MRRRQRRLMGILPAPCGLAGRRASAALRGLSVVPTTNRAARLASAPSLSQRGSRGLLRQAPRPAKAMAAVVVYIHGLWLTGAEAVLLRRRLSHDLGAETRAFAYRSVNSNLSDNAGALEQYLSLIRTDRLHLVAHSLGGLVVLKLFERPSSTLPPGRVVLLGSPVCGSRSAQRLARLPFGRAILGRTVADGLLAPRERRWQGGRDLGVIAGDSGLGLGRLLGPMA